MMKNPMTKKQNTFFKTFPPTAWDATSLARILDGFRGKRILVVGDVGIDRYTHGAVERISPEAPVPIVRVESEQHKLGLAANVADNIRTLGAEPWLVGVVGKDRAASDMRTLLRDSKVSPRYLVVDDRRRTVLKERIVSDRQQLLRVDYEDVSPISRSTRLAVLEQVKALVDRCDGIILQDYAKGMVTEELAARVFAVAKKAKKFVAVDPHVKAPLERYVGATFLTPNLKEAEALTGISIRDTESLVAAGRQILKKTQAKEVVITRGKDGMAVFHDDGRPGLSIPTYAREVYDVSGAGDTVISVLGLGRAAGASLEDSVILGNLAAGVEVGKRGTATVSPEEIRVAMEFFSRVNAADAH
jgi:rfaE bifunctional protein kinase chain/domain